MTHQVQKLYVIYLWIWNLVLHIPLCPGDFSTHKRNNLYLTLMVTIQHMYLQVRAPMLHISIKPSITSRYFVDLQTKEHFIFIHDNFCYNYIKIESMQLKYAISCMPRPNVGLSNVQGLSKAWNLWCLCQLIHHKQRDYSDFSLLQSWGPIHSNCTPID